METPAAKSKQTVLTVVGCVLAVIFLQLQLTAYQWLPRRSVREALEPAWELPLIVVALFGIAQRVSRKRPWLRRFFVALLSLWVVACFLLAIAQGIAKREFGYDFELAYHSDKIEALFEMMRDAQGKTGFALTLCILALLAFAFAMLSYHALAFLERNLIEPSSGSVLVLSVAAFTLLGGLFLDLAPAMTPRLIHQIDETVHREERIATLASSIDEKISGIEKLVVGNDKKRPSILFFVVESYGTVLYEADKYKDFRGFAKELFVDLKEAGYHMRTRTYTAPVFGGSSWLANASILCRYPVASEKEYFSLLQTKTACLPKAFNEAGYESYFVAPNTTRTTGAYERKFPFTHFVLRDDFGYEGPRMSWSYMPDQYAIEVAHQKLLKSQSHKPMFVLYKLTSSHHPWDTIPPVLDSWNEIGSGAIFEDISGLVFEDNRFLGGKHYNEGYEASIRYSLEVIRQYMKRIANKSETLIVVLGDHQPRRPVADMDTSPWTVPVHVFSTDEELIDRFEVARFGKELPKAGSFAPGLERVMTHLFWALNDVRRNQRPPSE